MNTLHDPKMKLLIISADQETVQSTTRILKSFGYQNIQTTDNGIVGLNMLTEGSLNFAICDMNMKFIGGWTFVKEVKVSEKIRNIPIVLLGTAEAPASQEEMKHYGIVQYMKLPVRESELSFLINSTIQLFKTSGTIEHKYTKAKDALIEEKTQDAVAMYSELRNLTKNHTRSSLGLAEAYIHAKEVEKAEKVVISIPDSEAASASGLLFKAEILLKQKNFQEALRTIERVTGEVASDVPFYYLRCARLLLDHNQTKPAEDICSLALSKDFKHPEFALILAKAAYRQTDFPRSLQIVSDALSKMGASADLLTFKGVCLRKLKRYPEAVVALEQALSKSPMDARIYFNLALISVEMWKYEKAAVQFETCIKISPHFLHAKENLDKVLKAIDTCTPVTGMTGEGLGHE